MPIKEMIEFLNMFAKIDSKLIRTHSAAFEDNDGALQLALEHKHRSRTKHMCVKIITSGSVSKENNFNAGY